MTINYAVHIHITEVQAIDHNIDGFGGGEADFYAKIKIGNYPEYVTKYKEDDDHVYPHWVHMRGFQESDFTQRIPITLKLRDDDSGIFGSSPDIIDTNPDPGHRDRTLTLSFDPHAGNQDVAGHLYRGEGNSEVAALRLMDNGMWRTETIIFRGGGDSPRAEIRFHVSVLPVPDFRIESVDPTANAQMLIRIVNDGGPGKLTHVGYYDAGGGMDRSVELVFSAGEQQTYSPGWDYIRGRTVEIVGEDDWGHAEINTANNTFTLP